MPAHDRDHDAVCGALVAGGWTITGDPLHLRHAGDDLYVDLAAERLIAAERGLQRIAVEIKSFAARRSSRTSTSRSGSSWCTARSSRRWTRSESFTSPSRKRYAPRSSSRASPA